MGFLDNLAIRKAERSLRPFMRADERIIEYDIANVQQIGRNVPVVLTNRAIYFTGGTSIRVPYEHILDLQARGRLMIAFSTKSGNAFLIEIVGAPKGDLYETISHHLEKAIEHQQLIEVPNGQVFAICRRIEEDGPLTWVIQSSEDVSVEDPAVHDILHRELAPVVERTGASLNLGTSRAEPGSTESHGRLAPREVKELQTEYAYLNAELAPLLAEAKRMSEIQNELEALGAYIDWDLCDRVKREMGVEDTPFNTKPGTTELGEA